jgi:hypothetical protein
VIAVAVVILLALAFVLIFTSPRRRIPPGSIVLLDRSQLDAMPSLLLSNATTRNLMVTVPLGSSRPTVKFLRSWKPIVSIAPHGTERVVIPDPQQEGAKLKIMVTEEVKGPERWWRAAQLWLRSRNGKGFKGNPFGTNAIFYGHGTDFAPEPLNDSTNRIAKGLN